MANRNKMRLEFYPERCTGCRTCEEICASYHYNGINLARSRIKMIRNDDKGLDTVTVCTQCEEKPCIEACPVDAIFANKDGTIKIDDSCIECNECKEACPYDGIHEDPQGNKYIVCDLCDGDPQCAKWCPFDAIQFREEHDKELDEKHQKMIKEIKDE